MLERCRMGEGRSRGGFEGQCSHAWALILFIGMAMATSRRADECCVTSVTGLNHSHKKNSTKQTNERQ